MKLNIGCGPNRKKGWDNIDLLPDVDLSLDMREAMPFSENSATIIYSEHFFEHLDYPEPAKRFLKECHRILRPGGIFSVGVPDTEWPLLAYVGPAARALGRQLHILKARIEPDFETALVRAPTNRRCYRSGYSVARTNRCVPRLRA
jgi:SAM-dependent methyltransferase